MFRCKIADQEVIVLFSSNIPNEFKSEKDKIYRQILSIGEGLLAFKNGTSFTVSDSARLIVAEVKKNDLLTIYIQHIVEKPFMYNAAEEETQAG